MTYILAEEREEAKTKDYTDTCSSGTVAQAQVSARWEADLKHGSWLSKNIRPLTLIFLTVCICGVECL